MRNTLSKRISVSVAPSYMAWLITLAGCAPARPPVSAPTAAAEAAGAQPSEPSPRADATLAEASAACDRVQENAEIPVTCRTDYIDQMPSMLVGFRSIDEANAWLGPFARDIGQPFCEAANRSQRPASVYMAVGSGDDRRGRRFSCELGTWGEWFSLAEPDVAKPQTIAEAIQACNRVQADEGIPIACATDYLDGVPAMIVGFRTSEEADKYLSAMAQQVAKPFCDAANRANRRAALIITVAGSYARPFDCEQQRWGEWFSIPARSDTSRGTMH
jgi:hypothetical protein